MERLVSPKEVLDLSTFFTVESMFVSYEIVEETIKRRGKCKDTWDYRVILANVYEAGRIQGKREERQGKK